jgi:hypothetical protein
MHLIKVCLLQFLLVFTLNSFGATTYDWTGISSSSWTTPGNWSIGGVSQTINYPGSGGSTTDIVRIGVTAYTALNDPALTTALTCASIEFGSNNGGMMSLTITGITLTITGNITQDHNGSTGGIITNISGSGTLSCSLFQVGDNTPPPTPPNGNKAVSVSNATIINSSITSLSLSSNLIFNTTVSPANNSSSLISYNNAVFNLTGGVANITGNIQTTNANTGNSSSLVIIPTGSATLQLANAAALSGLSSTGTNTITFNNTGATVEYMGAGQTVYTAASITGLTGGVSYGNIEFSGTGIKTVSAGNLNIAGNFYNLLANDAGDYVALNSPAVNFNGSNGAISQSLNGGSGNGTTLYTVNFSGASPKTIVSGNFYVASSGVLTMTSPATLVAGSTSVGYLTLNSDNTGSAAIAPIPIAYAAPPISGFVNVQRYLTGNRGYRLISSPVYAGTASGNNIYSLNYLKNSLYLTGTGGTAGWFTTGGNPTIYLYDESFSPLYSSFLNSNFIGVSSISSGTGTSPTYTLNANGAGLSGSYSIPAGTGFLCFFRGNLSEGAANLTNPSYSALTATVTATGTLNQGQVVFKDWYNPGSVYLGSSSQYFHLIGNPYASAIDLGAIQTTTTTTGIYATPFNTTSNTGITKFIYELNPVSHVFGVYDDNSGVGTNGASRYIASGQGFLVQAYGNACQFIFNETGKATTGTTATATNGLMVTKADLATINQVNTNPVIRLKLARDSVNNEEIVLAFNPAAKTQYVINEDAPNKPGQGQVGFSSNSSDNIQMAVNTMPLQKSQTINLNVYGKTDGLYTLNMAQVQALPAIYDVWLMDAYKNDSLDIKHNPAYGFNILNSDPASFGANRFSLVIRQNPALMVRLLNFTATKATGGAQVAWTTENEQNYTNFTIERSTDGGVTFNVLGGFPSGALGIYSFLDKYPPIAADQYRLKLGDLNGAISYSKVVTLIYGNGDNIVTSKINVYPNPSAGVINLEIQQNGNNGLSTNSPLLQTIATTPGLVSTSSGVTPSYDIKIINLSGMVIKTGTTNTQSWQTDVSNLMPGTYIVQVVKNNDGSEIGKSTFIKL